MRFFIPIFCCVLLTACANIPPNQYQVTVNALAQPNVSDKKRYFLMPGNNDITWQDQAFKTYADYIWRVLNMRGYHYTADAQQADIGIVVSYGVGAPVAQQYTYTVPRWGTSTVNGTTTMVITGYTEHTGTRYVYNKHLKIVAYDYLNKTQQQKMTPLWQVEANNVDLNPELGPVFPFLVGATLPYLASNTLETVNKSISQTDKSMQVVLGPVKQQQ